MTIPAKKIPMRSFDKFSLDFKMSVVSWFFPIEERRSEKPLNLLELTTSCSSRAKGTRPSRSSVTSRPISTIGLLLQSFVDLCLPKRYSPILQVAMGFCVRFFLLLCALVFFHTSCSSARQGETAPQIESVPCIEPGIAAAPLPHPTQPLVVI